jgi:carbon monoxide dehydrogenase subunit G
MEGRMVGRGGSIAGRAAFRLIESEGGTVVHYVGSAIIGGPLARVDSRFVEGLAASLVNEGLSRLGERLQRIPTAAARR